MSICRKCGSSLPPNAAVCPFCGMPVTIPQAGAVPPPSPMPQGNIPPQQYPAPYTQPYGSPYNVPQYQPIPPVQPVQQPIYRAPQAGTTLYQPLSQAEPDGGLSTSQYFWMMILFAIPIIGLIFMLYWAFADGVTPARKRFARALLIKAAVTFGIVLILSALWGSLIFAALRGINTDTFSSAYGSYTSAAVSAEEKM